MPAVVQEWLNLLVRWVHVIAAIMWVGDSFLFMWLDTHLEKPLKAREGDVVGELWLTHSGGFYEVVKRKTLRHDELPLKLHWFKWESYGTWLSGFALLVIVYHWNRGALLLDPNTATLGPQAAIGLSLALLPAAVLFYELLWATPLKHSQPVFAAAGLASVVAVAFELLKVFSARGTFLQVGAMLGTVMAANVFFRIIPAQRHMLAMTQGGQPLDPRFGLSAKGRSIQNHYLTLPVLFAMLSNHFPSTYGHARPELILGLLFLFGVGLKYAMNRRLDTHPVLLGGTLLALGAVAFLTRPSNGAGAAAEYFKGQPPVSYATVTTILEARCLSCHAQKPTSPLFAAPPLGVVLTSPASVSALTERIFMRAVATRTMPLGNITGMTDDERNLLGAWFAQGADVNAAGPSQLNPPAVGAVDAGAVAQSPADEARALFTTLCVACHGPNGDAVSEVAKTLNPKPRNFTDAAWQASVNGAQLGTVILKGGAAVGKSPVMPANPQLESKPEVILELVKIVRGFGAKR